MAHGRRGGYLAFVHPGVAFLQVVNHEQPVLGALGVAGGEAGVRRVGEAADRQEVDIPVAHP